MFPHWPTVAIAGLLLCSSLPPTTLAQSSSVISTTALAQSSSVDSTTTTIQGLVATKTIYEQGKLLGRLCEEDNDEVGQKLGCDCLLNKGTNLADCSDRTIKIGTEALPLPTKLNVSSHIRILDLSFNMITHIDSSSFGQVSGITELRLSNNHLVSIENLNFPRLTRLDLSHNNITNLTSSVFTNASKLIYLDLSHNALTYIDPQTFNMLEYLEVLKLAFNRLENECNWMERYPFILNNLSKLEELDLTNASLVEIPPFALNGTRNLRRLILKHNLMSILPTETFAMLTELEVLDLSGNYFTHLPADGFVGLGNLKNLAIDYTRGLRTVEAYAFSGLSSLQTLSCENNYQLSFIDSMAFRGNPGMNSSDSNPKVVQLAYNNLRYFEFPLLKWSQMEELELYGNPWVCDCNLHWVSDFTHRAPTNATILIDSDFKCTSPRILRDIPVAAVEPNQMFCSSEVVTVAGIIAIVIFSFVMIGFFVLIGLHQFHLLPDCFNKIFGMFGAHSAVPRYHKVQPKPSGIQHHPLESENPEVPADLDWDTGDISHGRY